MSDELIIHAKPHWMVVISNEEIRDVALVQAETAQEACHMALKESGNMEHETAYAYALTRLMHLVHTRQSAVALISSIHP